VTRGQYFGGMEAGGTKFNCLVGRSPDEVLDQVRISTTTPAQTLQRVIEFFSPFVKAGEIGSIGVGSFGPCGLVPGSSTFGFITSTPKPGWQNTDVVGPLRAALGVEVAFDTDVNTAAFGEFTWGATIGTDPSLYLTVGTGIGGGLIVGGRPLHGLHHPEMGHIRIPHDRVRDPFAGTCPFHGDCFEGLASGPAIQHRFGRKGETLADDDPFWQLESEYIAAAISNYILVASPSRIVVGGGIMQREFLLPMVRQAVVRLLAGYVDHSAVVHEIDQYIVPPGLGQRSGMLGAIALAGAGNHERRRLS
jgi:fructokinase